MPGSPFDMAEISALLAAMSVDKRISTLAMSRETQKAIIDELHRQFLFCMAANGSYSTINGLRVEDAEYAPFGCIIRLDGSGNLIDVVRLVDGQRDAK